METPMAEKPPNEEIADFSYVFDSPTMTAPSGTGASAMSTEDQAVTSPGDLAGIDFPMNDDDPFQFHSDPQAYQFVTELDNTNLTANGIEQPNVDFNPSPMDNPFDIFNDEGDTEFVKLLKQAMGEDPNDFAAHWGDSNNIADEVSSSPTGQITTAQCGGIDSMGDSSKIANDMSSSAVDQNIAQCGDVDFMGDFSIAGNDMSFSPIGQTTAQCGDVDFTSGSSNIANDMSSSAVGQITAQRGGVDYNLNQVTSSTPQLTNPSTVAATISPQTSGPFQVESSHSPHDPKSLEGFINLPLTVPATPQPAQPENPVVTPTAATTKRKRNTSKASTNQAPAGTQSTPRKRKPLSSPFRGTASAPPRSGNPGTFQGFGSSPRAGPGQRQFLTPLSKLPVSGRGYSLPSQKGRDMMLSPLHSRPSTFTSSLTNPPAIIPGMSNIGNSTATSPPQPAAKRIRTEPPMTSPPVPAALLAAFNAQQQQQQQNRPTSSWRPAPVPVPAPAVQPVPMVLGPDFPLSSHFASSEELASFKWIDRVITDPEPPPSRLCKRTGYDFPVPRLSGILTTKAEAATYYANANANARGTAAVPAQGAGAQAVNVGQVESETEAILNAIGADVVDFEFPTLAAGAGTGANLGAGVGGADPLLPGNEWW